MTARTEPAGHLPTLVSCFLHFDVCFMLWVLVGALGGFVFDGSAVDPALKGLIVGVPILTGSLLRVPLGVLADRIGARRVAIGLLLFLVVPLLTAWLAAAGAGMLLLVGLLLGAAGASFAIVLPMASRWYPPHRQGLVMGIAAAGNSGTVLANLLAPRLAQAIGWQAVFGAALIPLVAVLLLFSWAARDAPAAAVRRPGAFQLVLRSPDTWWLCLFYSVTFGGFVGLSSFLPLFLKDQLAVTAVAAGALTAAAAAAGSLVRPAGGYLADRLGGDRVLQALLATIAVGYLYMATLPAVAVAAPVLIATMVCLGLGNGVVFQLVPERFRRQIGIVTGIVGAVGGLGGFALPTLLGAMKQGFGSFAHGFLVLAVLAAGSGLSLWRLRRPTRQRSWSGNARAALAVDEL
jgi:NNP family nitrate/nitrite transporter-like MFS transporter